MQEDSSDRITKLRPVVDYLLERFQGIYRPGRNISIDESLMKFHGRLSFKQFNRNKRARFGVKFYKTCDSTNGYIYNFKIYVGQDRTNANFNSLGVSGQVVVDMLADLPGQGRNLFVDNWYSSPLLFKKLHDDKTNVCGTVRTNRKFLPKIIGTLQTGQMKIYCSTKMSYMVWKDKKLVTMLTTMQYPSLVASDKIDYRTKEPKLKPNIVSLYNKNMGGVDLSDQSIRPYECNRKCMKWYIKTYFHLFDIAIFNAFIVYNILHPRTKKTLLEFRLQLANEIIQNHCNKSGPSRKKFSTENAVRFTSNHFPSLLDVNNKSIRKRCVFCSKQNVRKDTRYFCKTCGSVPLCVFPCFEKYHTKG